MWHISNLFRRPSTASTPLPLTVTSASQPRMQQTSVVPTATAPAEQPISQPIDVRAENIKSVIAEGEFIEGNITFQRGAKIDGRIKGHVAFGLSDGMLVLNERGVVEGNIEGPRAIIVGEVFGSIQVTGKLIIMPKACVHGDIAAGILQVQPGSTIVGRISTISEDDKRRTLKQDECVAESIPDALPVAQAPEMTSEVLRFSVGGRNR